MQMRQRAKITHTHLTLALFIPEVQICGNSQERMKVQRASNHCQQYFPATTAQVLSSAVRKTPGKGRKLTRGATGIRLNGG